MGRFYPAEGAFPLAIDVEFRLSQSRRSERFAFNLQSLVPIDGDADPFLTRVRQAMAQHH
jgi:hypothetical protein